MKSWTSFNNGHPQRSDNMLEAQALAESKDLYSNVHR